MTSLPRTLALSGALALHTVAAAAQTPAPDWLDRLGSGAMRFGAQMAVTLLRSVADVTYDEMLIADGGRSVTLIGLTLRPDMPGPEPLAMVMADAPPCVITVARAEILLGEPDTPERTTLELTGIDAPLACLSLEAETTATMLGLDRLAIDRAGIDLHYDFASSRLQLAARLSVPDAGEIGADADFGYFWVKQTRGMGRPVPAIRLDALSLDLENSGLIERLRPMMQAREMTPDRLEMMTAAGLGGMLSDNGRRRLSEAERAFVKQTAEAVGGFAKTGGRIALRARAPEGIWLDPETEPSPGALIEAFAPGVTHGEAPPEAPAIAPAMLAAALAGEPLDDADRLRVARAMMLGKGAPLAPALGAELAAPLADAGHPEVLRLIADALADTDPEAAYAAALRAGGAAGALDRIEPRLPLARVLALQDAARDGALDALPGDLGAGARIAALAAAEGRLAPRDYARAWLLASLSAATGDRAAAALRDRLDLRLTRRDAAAWRARAATLQATSLALWAAAPPRQ
jgi:hypothetical protein